MSTEQDLDLGVDWKEPFTVKPVSLHPNGCRPYEYRVEDADGITFATTASKEKADFISALPELMKQTLVAVQLEAAVSSCAACTSTGVICDTHARTAEELSAARFELLMRHAEFMTHPAVTLKTL